MTTIKKLEDSRVEIEASISAKDLSAYRVSALKNINDEVSIDGFRKGKVPESVLVEKVGDMTIVYEMAELAIADAYPKILEKEKIEAIGRPEVKITKIAKDSPLEFTITTAVMPEITVGDYKKIAKAEMKKEFEVKEVTDEEVDKVMVEIEKQHGHAHDEPDYKQRVRDSLNAEKKHIAMEKRRLAIADEILKTVEVTLPRIMVEQELARSEAQFRDDMTRLNVKLEDYLEKMNKSMDDLRKDWEEGARKKATLQLALNKIAEKEKLSPDAAQVEKEVAMIIEHYPKADPIQARIYAETVLTNDKVFAFLEQQ